MTVAFDVEALREAEFPLSRNWAYLDHAAVSPMPNRTAEVLRERIETLQDPSKEHGQREHFADVARQRLGRLMNVPSQQIALVANLAEGMSIVANGMRWRSGDEVVIPEQEFSSLVYPWMNLGRFGVKIRFVPKEGSLTRLDTIAAAITPRTRALAVSHVEFQNGYRHDMETLGELCREKGVLLAVDATQSVGVLPVDTPAWQADVVAAHAYKWIMAMHGIAALYISENIMDRIVPTAPGRSSVTGGFESLDFSLDWHPDARRYQSGGPNWIGAAAVATSLEIVESIGIVPASEQATGVASRILEDLCGMPVTVTTDLDAYHRSQILSFTVGSADGDSAIVAACKENGVYIGKRGMGIRVAAHFWNNNADADRLLEAVDREIRRSGC
jgi:selenocysteine lyase/cysteine desulfurase